MVSLRLSIPASEVGERIRDRLRGTAAASAARVVWQRFDGQRVLLYLNDVRVKFVDGWAVCQLDVQTDQTERQTLQFVYFLGRSTESDGAQAAASINAPAADAARIAAVWGSDLQRVIWDALLDCMEASMAQAAAVQPGQKLTCKGFHCTATEFTTEVITGDI